MSSIFRCKAAFSEVVSEAQCDFGVLEVVFERPSSFGTGGGADAHKGLEDCILYFSVGIRGGGVDCDWAVRRRDRKGDDVFFRGGNSDGSSNDSRLRFRGVVSRPGGALGAQRERWRCGS